MIGAEHGSLSSPLEDMMEDYPVDSGRRISDIVLISLKILFLFKKIVLFIDADSEYFKC